MIQENCWIENWRVRALPQKDISMIQMYANACTDTNFGSNLTVFLYWQKAIERYWKRPGINSSAQHQVAMYIHPVHWATAIPVHHGKFFKMGQDKTWGSKLLTCPDLPSILPWVNIEATKNKVNFSTNSNQWTNSLTNKLTVNTQLTKHRLHPLVNPHRCSKTISTTLLWYLRWTPWGPTNFNQKNSPQMRETLLHSSVPRLGNRTGPIRTVQEPTIFHFRLVIHFQHGFRFC